jgi:hypothetical protein
LRVSHFEEQKYWFIVAPFSSAFERRSPTERQDILARLTACVEARKRRRLEGTTLIAWLRDGFLEYTAPLQSSAPVPTVKWIQLMGMLNEQVYCDDPVIFSQLTNSVNQSVFRGHSQAA